MKAILTDEETLVYGTMEENNISIATLHKGDEVELGKVTRKKKATWVEIALPGDQKGYIAGETKIFTIKRAQLASKTVDMVNAPSADARVVKTYSKGAIFTVKAVEKVEEVSWFKVVDDDGSTGYIQAGATKLKVVTEPTRSGAIRNIITGLIFAIVGVVLTFLNSNPESGISMVYVSYAVIFFGLLQMGQGGLEYYKVTRAKAKSKE